MRIQISMSAPGQVEQGVLDGRLHVGVIPQVGALSGLEYQPLYSERAELYCAAGHPLFALEDSKLTLEELRRHDAISPSFRVPAEVQQQFQALRCTATASDREGIAFLLLTGHYIGYLPDHYAAQWVASGRMRALDPTRYHYDLVLSAVTRKGRRPHLVLESFLEALAGTPISN